MSHQVRVEALPVTQTDRPSNYKWYVLVLAALTHTLVVAMPVMSLPVLFKEISLDLGLNLVQLGVVWGLGSLTGIFVALLGGAIGDRFGPKQTLMVTCFLAGISGAMRGLAVDFMTLSIAIFVFGIFTPIVPINVHKSCSIWFDGKQLGLANGIVSTGMALGFMLGSIMGATYLSPWLGGWRNVLFFYGALSIIISIFWALTKAVPDDETAANLARQRSSIRQGLAHVVHLKNVWLLGVALLGIGGGIQGALGYLPLYLRDVGWPPATADNALAMFHAVSMLGTIPLAMLSDRLGTRRPIMMVATLMIATGIGMLSVVQGALVWGAVILAGSVRDGFMAILMTQIVELKGIGPAFAGTATGLIIACTMFGGVVSPPVGNSLAAIYAGLPFLFWSLLVLTGFFSLTMIKEK